jgi:hypothetical protein
MGPNPHLFDVVFIDSLHTYEQSAEDVRQSLRFLAPSGVIIMHDCNPPHEASAQRAQSYQQAARMNVQEWTGEWCGDVWKTICFLRSAHNGLEPLKVFVLNCDYGIGVVTRGQAESSLNLTPEQISKMTYADLDADRENLLNLKLETYAEEFIRHL